MYANQFMENQLFFIIIEQTPSLKITITITVCSCTVQTAIKAYILKCMSHFDTPLECTFHV